MESSVIYATTPARPRDPVFEFLGWAKELSDVPTDCARAYPNIFKGECNDKRIT